MIVQSLEEQIMILSFLFVSACFANTFSPPCPTTIDDGFVDMISHPDDDSWQTTLTDETLDDIREVIHNRGPLVDHTRTLTSKGVQCWYKMPQNSAKKLDFVIKNYD